MVAVAVVAKSGNQTSFQSESLHRVRAVSVWALDTAKPVTRSGPERKKKEDDGRKETSAALSMICSVKSPFQYKKFSFQIQK